MKRLTRTASLVLGLSLLVGVSACGDDSRRLGGAATTGIGQRRHCRIR